MIKGDHPNQFKMECCSVGRLILNGVLVCRGICDGLQFIPNAKNATYADPRKERWTREDMK